jgi:predicted lysophospholipase L1 biosynthesis ABC-type transport system permease subunit
MAAKSTYELQAKLSVGLAIVGGLSALFAGFCILSRLDLQTFLFTYDPQGKRFLAVMAGLAMGMLTGGIGFLVGFNSAGQRLNKQNRLAWTGFLLRAAHG